jgi:hypothetical protein
MRHRLALVAQTLWAAVHGLASLQITHGCKAWLSWAPLGRRSETRLVAPARFRRPLCSHKAAFKTLWLSNFPSFHIDLP